MSNHLPAFFPSMGLLLLNTFYGLFTSCIGEIKFMKYYIWPARLIFMFSAIFFHPRYKFFQRGNTSKKPTLPSFSLLESVKLLSGCFIFWDKNPSWYAFPPVSRQPHRPASVRSTAAHWSTATTLALQLHKLHSGFM